MMKTKPNKKQELALVDQIERRIYLIRGERIMLDSDLAAIYQVETKVLNQAVKRNLKRFPEDFMFQLSEVEFAELRNSSQFVTSSRKHRGATYRPFAFTEHGAVMLASVLNSPTAVQASISVVRAFVKLRDMIALHDELAERIEELERVTDHHGQKFAVIFATLTRNNARFEIYQA